MADEKKERIDYRKVAENSLTRNTKEREFLDGVYARLSQMPEADIGARISEIKEAMQLVDRDTARTQRMASTQEAKRRTNQLISEGKIDPVKDGVIAPEDVSDEEKAKTMTSLDELTLIGTQLENEAEMLEYFPRVKARLQAIEEAKADAEKQDVLLTSAMAEAKEDLEAAEEAAKKAIENAEKAKQMDNEIAEIELEMEEAKAKGRKQKVIDAYLEEIEEKRGERAELGTEEEWEEAINGTKEPEDRIKSIKQGQKKMARVINKCSNPWSTILKGYGWVEIGELTSSDLSQMIGIKVKTAELDRYEDDKGNKKDGKDGKDKDKKEKDGKGTMTRGGDYYIPPSPVPEPVQEPESEPEQDEEPEHDDADKADNSKPVKTWAEKHKILSRISILRRYFRRREKEKNLTKQERKELAKKREEAFVEKFCEENKGEPSFWQKLAVRLFGEKDDDRKDPPTPPSGGREGEAPASAEAPTPAQPEPTKELRKLTAEQIENKRNELKAAGLSDKQIDAYKSIAEKRVAWKEGLTIQLTEEQKQKRDVIYNLPPEEQINGAIKALVEDGIITIGEANGKMIELSKQLGIPPKNIDGSEVREGIKTSRGFTGSQRTQFRAQQKEGAKQPVIEEDDFLPITEPILAPADGPALPEGEAHGEDDR